MTAQSALGFDNGDSLVDITPQPHMSGLIYRTVYSAGSAVYRDGAPITRWSWGFLRPAEWEAIKTALGLSESVKSAENTINTLTNDFDTYDSFNATAILPEPDTDYRYEGGRFLDVVITFRGLEAI